MSFYLLHAPYAYDGLHRYVTMTADSTTCHFYHPARWQAIEERLGTSTNADRQFLWDSLYLDHLVLRDRDVDGTLDERLCHANGIASQLDLTERQ